MIIIILVGKAIRRGCSETVAGGTVPIPSKKCCLTKVLLDGFLGVGRVLVIPDGLPVGRLRAAKRDVLGSLWAMVGGAGLISPFGIRCLFDEEFHG
jgi:hypothetical protein